MQIPPLSHLQALVLDCMGAREINGRDLRAALAGRKMKKTGPAFYQMMSRLEESGFVKGKYQQKTLDDGQVVKERFYRITGQGVKAMQANISFYSNMEGVKA